MLLTSQYLSYTRHNSFTLEDRSGLGGLRVVLCLAWRPWVNLVPRDGYCCDRGWRFPICNDNPVISNLYESTLLFLPPTHHAPPLLWISSVVQGKCLAFVGRRSRPLDGLLGLLRGESCSVCSSRVSSLPLLKYCCSGCVLSPLPVLPPLLKPP